MIGCYTLLLDKKQCILDKYAIDVLAVCIPFFHSIARIGCFLSGCCYGKKYNGVGSIQYVTMVEGGVDINYRMPVQILESVFEIILFFYLFLLLKSKEWMSRNILKRYLILYSDVRRGIINGISFSQVVSVFIWLILMGKYFRKHILKTEEKNNG